MKNFFHFFLIIFTLFILENCASETELPEECSFDINLILNGPNFLNPVSEWNCIDNQNNMFSIGFFEDKTGIDSTEGQFIWQEIRCGTIEYSINFKNVVLSQISLNKDLSLLNFERQVDGNFSSITCNINSNPLDIL